MITVGRQGEFIVSEDSMLENINIFSGKENILQITRVYSTEWLCNFEMVSYPFDTQVKQKHKYIGNFSKYILEVPIDF